LILWVFTLCNIGGISQRSSLKMQAASSLVNTSYVTQPVTPEDQHGCSQNTQSWVAQSV